MDIVDELFESIDDGMLGLNQGLDMGLPKLEAIVDGVQRQTYTIIAGGTGSGKTTFALYSYVYRPILQNWGNDKFRVVYFSLEMTRKLLLAKILSLHLFEEYNIELSFKQIMSRQEILSEEHRALIEECKPWLREFCSYIVIYDKATITAGGLYANLMNYAEANGFFEETETTKRYTAYVKNQTVMVVVDHLGLINTYGKETKKDAMDKASKYLMQFRNMCAYSPLVLLQLNRSSSSMDRRSAEMQEIELSDIKDTSGPSEDAEVILAIFNPWREKMARYRTYNIKILQDRFRAVQVLKSRLGEADKSVPINFFGSIGYWRELPKADELAQLDETGLEQYLHLTKRAEKKDTVVETVVKPTFTFKL